MNRLNEIEDIRGLKSRYFRFLDTKQWDELRDILAPEFTALSEGPHPDITFSSPEEFIRTNREILADMPTVHQGHTSEITLLSETKAVGVWSMYDRVELPGNAFEGWGHYHEQYAKIDGEWKISHMHLTRLMINQLKTH